MARVQFLVMGFKGIFMCFLIHRTMENNVPTIMRDFITTGLWKASVHKIIFIGERVIARILHMSDIPPS